VGYDDIGALFVAARELFARDSNTCAVHQSHQLSEVLRTAGRTAAVVVFMRSSNLQGLTAVPAHANLLGTSGLSARPLVCPGLRRARS
jgi:hypothetical protein